MEENLLKLFYNFIKENSAFGEITLIVPKTPQSFSSFPTIVFKESNNIDYMAGKTLDRSESVAQLNYTVEIYTKDINFKSEKYPSLVVQRELKELVYKFFNDIGFRRLSSVKGEYIDITVDRNISIFEGKINNWNYQII